MSWHAVTMEAGNFAEVAHIVGFSKDGPRGEAFLSADLAKDVSNLMLLCRGCHDLVDKDPTNYTVHVLQDMKLAHEQRVELVTGIAEEKKSHVLLYSANVGDHGPASTFQRAATAMSPDSYPAETYAISLGFSNSAIRDTDDDFWAIEQRNLTASLKERLRPRLARGGDISHLAIFAVAPQPLLMQLGFSLSDIPSAETFQLHREPPGWKWRSHPPRSRFVVVEPTEIRGAPALVLSLSASISPERVKAVLGEDVTIWTLTVDEPHNDFLQSRQQLKEFRETVRPLLDLIKLKHGESSLLHVFPAMPVSTAVDFGRVLMAKADLPIRVYDQNRSKGGFVHALDLVSSPL
ncbi:MAG: SAVED domain-containing protein [Planctomycetes bacterium]|nr:SAVED domain-containing protein [Planctomycetota bacterium]